MTTVGIAGHGEYGAYLRANPGEYDLLFDTLLINHTGFFRDPEAWRFLNEAVVVPLARRASAERPLRIWSAGCASGEEAYSLAMLASEALRPADASRLVTIYATDMDDSALAAARLGRYPRPALDAIPDALRARYFDVRGNWGTVRKELRRLVLAGSHDLMRDPPIPHIDLVVCRNTLMYFRADCRARVLAAFRVALHDGGRLFAGTDESPGPSFAAVSLDHHLYMNAPLRGAAL